MMKEHNELAGTLFAIGKGENGWQTPAKLYSTGSFDLLAIDKFTVVEGTPPSYNNYCDLDRLLQTATHIGRVYDVNQGFGISCMAVGVKHGNPCGAAVGANPPEVLRMMMAGDPLAIFGGVILVDFAIDEELSQLLVGKMLDGIVSPSFTPDAIAALRRRGDKCRFIANPALSSYNLRNALDVAPRARPVRGGFMVQPNYTFVPDLDGTDIKKYGVATPHQHVDMMLAWAIGSTSNSNTITIVKHEQLLGNGVGQQDRVGAVQLALSRANRSRHEVRGAVAYSDSFFPFPDGPSLLADAGISAIFTSSGSINDKKTIDLCQERGIALYMVPDQLGRGFFGH